jgi:sugar O-acyltransferase (sialic acid O-acetyltransferase NeuD family)
MTAGVVIVGCGGHGREALGIVEAANEAANGAPPWRVLGFVDDRPAADSLRRVERLGVPYLGALAWLAEAPRSTHVVLGIGDPRVRWTIGQQIERYRLPAATLVHPDSTLGTDLDAGEGLLVFAGARVTTNVTIGRHVHLNQNSTVGHDTVLGDYVSINPLAAVSGGCVIGAAVLVGTTAAVLQQLHIGERATVGAGACVVRNVSPGTVVKGVPAR